MKYRHSTLRWVASSWQRSRPFLQSLTKNGLQLWLEESDKTNLCGTTQVVPKGDLVLAKVAEAEDKTLGGVLLPDSAQKKPTSGAGVVMACVCSKGVAVQNAGSLSDLLWPLMSIHTARR